MKIFLFLILIVSNISCGQNKIGSLSQTPTIFFSGQYETNRQSNNVDFLYTKTFEKDTSINGAEFKKFKWDKFKNYKGVHEVYFEFERISNEEYILLTEKLQNIHNLKLKPEEQTGILFGKEGKIGYEYVDTRTYFPKSDFVPGSDSPMKFYLGEDKSVFIYYEPDKERMDITVNNKEFKKSLTDGAFSIAAQILTRNDSMQTFYDIQPGDELQLVYTVGWTEFSSKGTLGKDSDTFTGEEKKLPSSEEITTMKCTDVKKAEGKRTITLDVSKFDSKKNKTENLSSIVGIEKNGNITIDNQVLGKEMTYNLDFKIDSADVSQIPDEYKDSGMSKYFLSFTGVTYDTLSGKPFPKALYINSVNYYQLYYLGYFPVPYAEYPGTTCKITYVKLKGKEYGIKR